jgi:hypothetical protein
MLTEGLRVTCRSILIPTSCCDPPASSLPTRLFQNTHRSIYQASYPKMTENEAPFPSPEELARAHHTKSLTASPIYGFLLRNLTVLPSTKAGTSIASLVLEPQHLNSKGSIHGSVSATIVDWASGNALATTGSGSGVSVDMHVTFMNTCKGGEKMIINVSEDCCQSEDGPMNRLRASCML